MALNANGVLTSTVATQMRHRGYEVALASPQQWS